MSNRISTKLVLQAYTSGYFPMADHRGRIEWHSPDPRCIFDLAAFKVSRSLRQTIQRKVFEIRINTAFEAVITACGEREEGTWISRSIRHAYEKLFREGWAHSVEAWQADRLVGGLYGVSLGGAFFGESMFHRETNASKVALAALVDRLRERGFALLDTQFITPHLQSLGAIEIPREDYLRRLAAALQLPGRFADQSDPAAFPSRTTDQKSGPAET